MTQFTKETTTTSDDIDNSERIATNRQENGIYRAEYIVYFIFGAIGVLLAFRFVLKLLGASPLTDFVNFIYSLSGIFVTPFTGIFNESTAQGLVTGSVLEPSTIIAFVVYAFIAWAIVALIRAVTGRQTQTV